MITFSLITTTAVASAASAQALSCGAFTTSLEKANTVVNGDTVGYVEILTDGCNNYEEHGHLGQTPVGDYAGPFELVVMAGNGAVNGTTISTAPADVFLSLPSTGSSIPAWFDIHVVNTDVNYITSFTYQSA
jgi:hypothetical protein